MDAGGDFEIFLATAPGLESVLCAEARAKGFREATAVQGGVTIRGGWPEVWRANLEIRGASRILARIAEFRALHLAQLDGTPRSHPSARWRREITRWRGLARSGPDRSILTPPL